MPGHPSSWRALHAPVDVAAAAFDQPFGAVKALPLVDRVEGPEVGGDQRLSKARPIGRRQLPRSAHRPQPAPGSIRPPPERDRVAQAAEANARVAVKAAAPDEAVSLGVAPHGAAQWLFIGEHECATIAVIRSYAGPRVRVGIGRQCVIEIADPFVLLEQQ